MASPTRSRTETASVVALVSFTVDRHTASGRPVPIFASRGMRYGSDDEIVRLRPDHFAPPDLTDSEYEARRQAIRDRKAAANSRFQTEAQQRVVARSAPGSWPSIPGILASVRGDRRPPAA